MDEKSNKLVPENHFSPMLIAASLRLVIFKFTSVQTLS